MRYALLIYGDETQGEQMSPEAQGAMMGAYQAFGERYQDKIRGGEPLTGSATATTVRTRGGKALTTDGPFAESKEQLGGFYIVECDHLDEAVEIASQIPGAAHGAIEVRPIMEFD